MEEHARARLQIERRLDHSISGLGVIKKKIAKHTEPAEVRERERERNRERERVSEREKQRLRERERE